MQTNQLQSNLNPASHGPQAPSSDVYRAQSSGGRQMQHIQEISPFEARALSESAPLPQDFRETPSSDLSLNQFHGDEPRIFPAHCEQASTPEAFGRSDLKHRAFHADDNKVKSDSDIRCDRLSSGGSDRHSSLHRLEEEQSDWQHARLDDEESNSEYGEEQRDADRHYDQQPSQRKVRFSHSSIDTESTEGSDRRSFPNRLEEQSDWEGHLEFHKDGKHQDEAVSKTIDRLHLKWSAEEARTRSFFYRNIYNAERFWNDWVVGNCMPKYLSEPPSANDSMTIRLGKALRVGINSGVEVYRKRLEQTFKEAEDYAEFRLQRLNTIACDPQQLEAELSSPNLMPNRVIPLLSASLTGTWSALQSTALTFLKGAQDR